MTPAEGTPPPPRRPRPKRGEDPIRQAAANGHAEWVDTTPAASWDPWAEPVDTPADPAPWGDAEAGADARGLDRTLGQWLEAVVPPEAQLHFFNAGREFAAGVQATLDHHLGGGVTDPDGQGGGQPVRIEIE